MLGFGGEWEGREGEVGMHYMCCCCGLSQQLQEEELKPGGGDIPVTEENKQEYIE